jgi:hypothetical protein
MNANDIPESNPYKAQYVYNPAAVWIPTHVIVKIPAVMAEAANTLNGPTRSAMIPGMILPGNENALMMVTR